jgi:hypothetical protein
MLKAKKIYRNKNEHLESSLPTTNKMNHLQNVPPMDREETLEWWLQEGHDPFHELKPGYRTAFDEASEHRDLELLLHMVAKPGTAWTKRFLFCRNREVEVPVTGHACIPFLLHNRYEDSFYEYESARSMEGRLEVLMMYGYKLKPIEICNLCFDIFKAARIDDTLTYRLNAVDT